VSAEDVRYIEAHGTGTKLGDPIETEALSRVFGEDRSSEDPLYVSSVKANIGHLEAAAGMAGMMSAIMALQMREAPPNAQLHVLNEKVAATVSDSAISFPREATPLHRRGDRRLLAGVSSFGYSGTIAHVILEEPPVEFAYRMESSLSIF
jgi:6-methylsalicylic acid synthase